MSAAAGFLSFAAGCGLYALVILVVAILEARAHRRAWTEALKGTSPPNNGET